MSSSEYISVSESVISAFGRVERLEDFLPIQFFIERTPELSHVTDEELQKVLEAFDLEIQCFRSEIGSDEKMLDAMSDLYKKIKARNLGSFDSCEVLQAAIKRFKTPGQQRVLLELCRTTSNREELVKTISSLLKEAA